ncbi:hypothetical protein [Sciscionella sediminilitoris]|uniref:hypothetical protein n=1 Tax=Sciscionella sediminilitoris TaxID=1445613 RepID=UPI00068C98AF|nr:hypothetical protein [Sciscionella sp. SE31]
MDMPGMDHAAQAAEAGTPILAVLLRIVLLVATAVVAGLGLLRPVVRAHSKRTTVSVCAAAGIAVLAAALSVPFAQAGIAVTVVQIVLTAAIAVLLGKPGPVAVLAVLLTGLLIAEGSREAAGGLWFALDLFFILAAVVLLGAAGYLATVDIRNWRLDRSRVRTLGLGAAAVLAVTGTGQLLASGVAFDRRLYQTAYGLVVFAGAVLAVLVLIALLLRRYARIASRAAAIAVVLSFGAWTAVAAIPEPGALPTPGVPELTHVRLAGKQVPLLVTPNRPGPNLVHFPDSAGRDITVTGADGHRVRAGSRPGAEGSWARVNLPAGRGTLTIGDQEVGVDTGTGAPLPQAAGPDGPECASAALGSLVTGNRNVLRGCPADALSAGDARDLRTTVGFLAGRGARVITVAGDASPRSTAAQRVVREAAARHGITIAASPHPDGALLVLAGWQHASDTLVHTRRAQQEDPLYAYGNYLAPWLLNAPIVNSVPTSELPLRFDPRVRESLEFSVALENLFGGENPSTAAYRSWAAETGAPVDAGLQIYGCAQVNAMPMDSMTDMGKPYPGQWIPDGTIVPVTGILR